MARGPLHYIILYTYSLLSLDRGWGPQSVSASACAREDRHVGGSRWADAIDIHSDAESIRIPLLVCHRVIWDPGYLVERIAICEHAESRLFEITIPHAARESAHVVVSPEHPQQSIRSLPPIAY